MNTNNQSSLSQMRKNFVTAEDINQLRQCFYAMEEIAQKSIQAKNRTIQELQDEIAELKQSINQRSMQINAMSGDIVQAKSRLKAQGALAPSDDLLDLVDASQQAAADELRRRGEAAREAEQRLNAAEADRRELKSQLDFHRKKDDDLRRMLTGGPATRGFAANQTGNGNNNDDRDVVALVEDRLASEEKASRDKDGQLAQAQARANDLRAALEDRERAAQRLQAERADAVERLRAAKDAVMSSQIGNKFRFAQPQTARGFNPNGNGNGNGNGVGAGDDLSAHIDARDREILDELNARDDEAADMRGRLRAMEEMMGSKAGDVEKLKQELAFVEKDRDAKLQEIQGLNEHARTQANVIRRKIEELEERDAQINDVRARLKAVEKDLDEKADAIESAEDELRARDDQIAGMQRKLQRAQEDIGSKLVVLSLLLEKLTAAKEDFESRDDEIDELSAKLAKVEEERRGMEDTLKRYKDDEIAIMHDNTATMGSSFRDDGGGPRVARPAGAKQHEEEELDRLFKTARQTLGVLGEKANFSFAALKTKDDLDSLYHEQLTVTGAEMILRDRKINLLVEKVEIAERYLNELLKILGQKGLMKYSSARASNRSQPSVPSLVGAGGAPIGTAAVPMQMQMQQQQQQMPMSVGGMAGGLGPSSRVRE